jgi:hypothetical protein
MTKPNAPQAGRPAGRSRDEILDDINRKLLTFVGMHHRCRAPVCRRLRRCADAGYRCSRDFPTPPLTEKQSDKVRADVHRALKAEIDRRKTRGEWTDL